MSESSTRAEQNIRDNVSPDNASGVSAPHVTSTETAEHYVWGEHCDGWHLVKTPSLSVISERMPAGTSEVAHRHHKAQQFFYVLRGELVLAFGPQKIVLHPGRGVHVPPLVVHQALNLSASDVEFLVISEPRSHGDRDNV